MTDELLIRLEEVDPTVHENVGKTLLRSGAWFLI